MEWWLIILSFFFILILFMILSVPIAISFLLANIITITIIVGFEQGLNQLVLSMFSAVAKFSLTPIPLFILMGELLFRSGLAIKTLNAMDEWLGRLPGRLSILAVGSGTAFAALSGSSMANTSMLGSLLVPDMRKRGYSTKMSVGPILAAGSLAMIIPPSAMIILMGGLGQIPVGPLLIAGIVPGLLLALLFIAYIIVANYRDKSLAPSYTVEKVEISSKLKSLFLNVIPLGTIIFMVIGLIFLGIATPTEAAAMGAVSTIIMIFVYRSFSIKMFNKAIQGTLKTNGMIMLIIATSAGYSQILAFTGASRELVSFITQFQIADILIIIILLLIVVILGAFMDPIATMMVLLPLYIPIVTDLGFDLIWFGIMMLICLDMGNLTPPVGMLLFIMKGVSPPDISMNDIFKSAIPIIIIEAFVVFLILTVPQIVLWLPSLGGT